MTADAHDIMSYILDFCSDLQQISKDEALQRIVLILKRMARAYRENIIKFDVALLVRF